MATTTYGVNHPLAVKTWRRALAAEALKATQVFKAIGKNANALLHLKDETQKGPGDQITFGLRMQLSGRGTQGSETQEGNEEALTVHSDSVLINELGHAVRSASSRTISQQRVPFDIREECMMALRDWLADRIDTCFFNQICGYTAETDTIYTGNQAAIAPDAAHVLRAGAQATDQALTSSHPFVLNLIDKAQAKARTMSPPIRPALIGGREWYVCFVHPWQLYQLRSDTSTAGNWFDLHKAALQGGQIDANALFTGAAGVYNNTLLVEASRVTQGVHSSTGEPETDVRRAVFCVAQAASIAFGRDNGPDRYTWVEEFFDYQRQIGVRADTIFGLKKNRFNSADFASIVIPTYAVEPT